MIGRGGRRGYGLGMGGIGGRECLYVLFLDVGKNSVLGLLVCGILRYSGFVGRGSVMKERELS